LVLAQKSNTSYQTREVAEDSEWFVFLLLAGDRVVVLSCYSGLYMWRVLQVSYETLSRPR